MTLDELEAIAAASGAEFILMGTIMKAGSLDGAERSVGDRFCNLARLNYKRGEFRDFASGSGRTLSDAFEAALAAFQSPTSVPPLDIDIEGL